MFSKYFKTFEVITRKAHLFTQETVKLENISHPFSERNIHSSFPSKVIDLFNDGHFSQATFEAFKYIDKEVSRISNISKTGYKLMMEAFSDQVPVVKLNNNLTDTEKDEQKGFQFIFSGSIMAIRNPRGHEYTIKDNIEDCLDHLSFVSMLLRRIEKAGYKLEKAQ